MTNSIQTYADYYKEIKQYPVSNSSLLVSVQHQWYLPGKIRKDTHEPILESQDKNTEITHNDPILVSRDEHRSLCDGLASTLLPLDVFMEAPIAQADLFFLCIFLPQILYCIERYEIASLFIDRCRDHLPILGSFLDRIAVDNFDEILEALTAKSCNLDQNYDRLEWLGDAVLKLVHTDSLLYSNQFYKLVSCLHEGDLSLLRSYLGSNKMLCSVCERIGFDKYILSRPFGRGQWAPSGIESYTIHSNGAHILSDMNQSRPGRKICADVIESLIGLIYIKFSFDAAYDVASELGITLPKGGNFISAAPDYKRNSDLDDAASRFLGGFRFKNPELLEEAITHPSCLHEKVSSYQRLEWVGDAVLCLFARNWIFHKFPNICVGELVAIESSIVCNETLAYICALNKLQVYMNHMDTSLPKKITDYEYSIGPKGRGLWSTGE
jgi:endoribonuclease Dicer